MNLRLPQGVLPASLSPTDHGEMVHIRGRCPGSYAESLVDPADWHALVDIVIDPRVTSDMGVDEKTKEIREATTAIMTRRTLYGECKILREPVSNEPRFEHHRYREDREEVWCASDAAFWLEHHLYMQEERAIVLVYDVEKTLGLLNVFPTVSDTIIYDLARDPILRFMYANRQEYGSRSVMMNVDIIGIAAANQDPRIPSLLLVLKGLIPRHFLAQGLSDFHEPSAEHQCMMLLDLHLKVQAFRDHHSHYLNQVFPVIPTQRLMVQATRAGAHRLVGGITPRCDNKDPSVVQQRRMDHWILRAACHEGCRHDDKIQGAGLLARTPDARTILHPEEMELKCVGTSSSRS